MVDIVRKVFKHFIFESTLMSFDDVFSLRLSHYDLTDNSIRLSTFLMEKFRAYIEILKSYILS